MSVLPERPLRVLVVSRSYPSDLLPMLGLWVEHPTRLLAERCDVRVLSVVPWCPPLPSVGPLRQYVRFRSIPRRETRFGVEIERPRFFSGFGRSLYSFESRAQDVATRRTVERLVSEAPFDLVHAHMIYPEGAVAHLISERYGVPFVVTEHAPWTERWFERRAVRRAALGAAEAAAQLLAVSTSVRDTIVSYTRDSTRVRVVPIGVDPETFRATGGPRAPRSDPVRGLDQLQQGRGCPASRPRGPARARRACPAPASRRCSVPPHAAPGGADPRSRGVARVGSS